MEKCSVCGDYFEPWQMNSFGEDAICNECIEYDEDLDFDHDET